MNHTWKIASILEFSHKKELNALIDGYDCNVSNLSIFSEASSEDSCILATRAGLKRLRRGRRDEKKEEAKREESEFLRRK